MWDLAHLTSLPPLSRMEKHRTNEVIQVYSPLAVNRLLGFNHTLNITIHNCTLYKKFIIKQGSQPNENKFTSYRKGIKFRER